MGKKGTTAFHSSLIFCSTDHPSSALTVCNQSKEQPQQVDGRLWQIGGKNNAVTQWHCSGSQCSMGWKKSVYWSALSLNWYLSLLNTITLVREYFILTVYAQVEFAQMMTPNRTPNRKYAFFSICCFYKLILHKNSEFPYFNESSCINAKKKMLKQLHI